MLFITQFFSYHNFIYIYLKSEDGLGDVNTVVVEAVLVLGTDEVVVVVLEIESGVVFDTVVVLGGGVHGGVDGGVPPILDDETTVSSIGTELCSWSRMIWRPALYLYAKKKKQYFFSLSYIPILSCNK